MRYLLTDLTPGKTYFLQFRSRGALGEVSPWSRTFSLTPTSDTVAPKTPTGLSVVSVGSSFRASWNAVTLSADESPATDLDRYLVKVESDSAPGVSRTYITPDTSFELTFEANADIFTTARGSVKFSVAAVDKTGNQSAYSSTVSASNPAPAAPTNLVLAETIDAINLSWDPNTTDIDLRNYEVWVSTTGSGGSYSKVWSGVATSATHSTSAYFTDHWYRVYSVDIFGTLSSALQSGAAVRPDSTFTADSTAPDVPTNLAATLTTGTNLVTYASVSWTAIADTDGDLAGYRIGYRPVGASDWSYTDVDSEQTSTQINNLTPYVEYDFRIRTYDWSANFSNWSSTVTTTTAASNTAPSAPTGVAISGGMQTATVTWNANSEPDLDYYEIQLDTANTFNTGNLQTVTTAGTVISFVNLTAGETYYTRVRAYDNLGLNSSWSSIDSDSVGTITVDLTDGNPPASSPTPSVLGGIGYIFANWTAVSNADPVTYEVYVSTSSGFTPSGATLVGETSSTMVSIEKTGAGTPLAYSTNYYVKIIARDADGAASASAASAAVQIAKVTSSDSALTYTDVGADPAGAAAAAEAAANTYTDNTADGKNTIVRSTSAASGTSYIAGDVWYQYSGSNVIGFWIYSGSTWVSQEMSNTVLSSLDAAKINTGFLSADRIESGTIAADKFVANTITASSGVIANAAILTAMIADANITTAKIENLAVTEGKIANLAVTTAKIDDLAVTNAKIGNLAVDTAQIANLAVTDAKINTLSANKITAGSGLINDLVVKSTLTLGDASTDGIIKSYNYVSDTSGYKLDKSGLEINDGAIKADALQIQVGANLAPQNIAGFDGNKTFFSTQFLEYAYWDPSETYSVHGTQGAQQAWVASTAGTRSKVWFGTSQTDYNITVEEGETYIVSIYCRPSATRNHRLFVKNDLGSVTNVFNSNVSSGAFTRIYGTYTVPAGATKIITGVDVDADPGTGTQYTWWDSLQVEKKIGSLDTPSSWAPPGLSTSIDGGIIRTGEIRSNNTIDVSGTELPNWSVNTEGNAQFSDALIRGKLIVGTSSETVINLAQGNGDFETNVTGWSVTHTGATGTALVRTTTAGEVISGTGSAKVTAASGAKTKLGIASNLITDVPAGNYIRITGAVETNTSEGVLQVSVYDSGSSELGSFVITDSPVSGDTYTFDGTVVLDTDFNSAHYIEIYQSGTLTTTAMYFDDIVIDGSDSISSSYVSSYGYQAGNSGWRIWGDGDVEFNNGIFRGTLGAETVDASALKSELIISSVIKTADTGRRAEFSESGIALYDSDDSLLVNMPTDSDSPATFYGDLLATSLAVSDDMSIGGTNNELARAASLTIQSGTTAPLSPPTVQVGWQQLQVNADEGWRDYRYGLAYNSVDDAWMTMQDIYGTNTNIIYWDATTGSQYWTQTKMNDIWSGVGGITVIGSEIFVFGTVLSDGSWKVEVRDKTTKAYKRTMNFPDMLNYRPAIGTDGTNIIIANARNSDKKLKFRIFNPSTMALIDTIYSERYITSGTTWITSCGYDDGVEFPYARYWYTQEGKSKVYLVTDTGAEPSYDYEFQTPYPVRGMDFVDDGVGTRFSSYNNTNGKISYHTDISWTDENAEYSTWHAGVTWYDSNSTGGTHETTVSPLTTFTMKKRAALTITSPPLPLRPNPTTNDDPVAVGLYMARNNTTPTNAQLEQQFYLDDGDTVAYLNRNGGPDVDLPTPDTNATTPPPTSNGFSGLDTAPGKIRSANDVFTVDGSGSGSWGDMDVASTGAITFNDAFVNSSMRPSQDYSDVQDSTTSLTSVLYGSGPLVSFVAPASGVVKVEASGACRCADVSNRKVTVFARIRTGTSASSGTIVEETEVYSSRNELYIGTSGSTVVTGLTAGSTYNCHLTFQTSDSNATAYVRDSRIIITPLP